MYLAMSFLLCNCRDTHTTNGDYQNRHHQTGIEREAL
jgi:hypothetical protein